MTGPLVPGWRVSVWHNRHSPWSTYNLFSLCSMKVANILKTKEPKQKIVKEQCVVYHFKWDLFNMDLFTNRQLHQRISEHMQAQIRRSGCTWRNMGSRNQPCRTIFWCSKNAEINSKALSGYDQTSSHHWTCNRNRRFFYLRHLHAQYIVMKYTNAIIIQTSTLLKT